MSSEVASQVKSTPSTSNLEQYKVKLPPGLKPILEELTREAIGRQPKNLDIFFADYFSRKLDERARDLGPTDFKTYLGSEESDTGRKRSRRRKPSKKNVRRQSRNGDNVDNIPSYDDDDNDDNRRRGWGKNKNCECPYTEKISKTEKASMKPSGSKTILRQETIQSTSIRPEESKKSVKLSVLSAKADVPVVNRLSRTKSTEFAVKRVSMVKAAPPVVKTKQSLKVTTKVVEPVKAKRKTAPAISETSDADTRSRGSRSEMSGEEQRQDEDYDDERK